MTSRGGLLVPLVGAAFMSLGANLTKRRPRLGAQGFGDAELLHRVSGLLTNLGGTRNRVSVAFVAGDETAYAHFGADADSEFEIGSVTKVFTGMLLADAIERGGVTPSTRLGEVLDLGESAAAGVTLGAIGSHRSGLPRIPLSPEIAVRTTIAQLRAEDPYVYELPDLLEQARAAQVGDRVFEYSNLGFALLGQALAAVAGTDFGSLLVQRMLRPLGLHDTYLPMTRAGLRGTAGSGYLASGRSSAPWTLRAYAPAGGLRSTPADMARFAQAVLEGRAPGMSALDPIEDADGSGRIGYAWLTSGGITWHNGMTGGYASYLGLDRAANRAGVVLSNTAVSVDEVGRSLLSPPGT